MSVGVAGEQIAIAEFAKRGVEVYTAAGPYAADLVVSFGGRQYTVQVKSTEATGKAIFRFRDGHLRRYPDGLIDLYAAVQVPSGLVALVEPSDRGSVTIDFDRISPAADFDSVLARLQKRGT